MALVVPMRRDGLTQSPSPMAATQPPDPNFLLMAAALMHRDGRLIKKDQRQAMDYKDISPLPEGNDPNWQEKFDRHNKEFNEWMDDPQHTGGPNEPRQAPKPPPAQERYWPSNGVRDRPSAMT